MHVAFSSSIRGAMDNVLLATTSCMSVPDLIDLNLLWFVSASSTREHRLFRKLHPLIQLHRAGTTYAYGVGSIDDPRNLQNSRVWLFSGKKDTVVETGVVKKAKMFYEYYITEESQVTMVTNVSAEHSWVSDSYGSACGFLGEPYINNCNFDASGAMLRHIYAPTPLNPRAASVNRANLTLVLTTTQIFAFSQREYTSLLSPASLSMGNTGYVYVPTACQKGALCKLVVAFHGCEMDIPTIKDAYYVHSGLNQWAETNNMIVLYPQAIVSSLIPYNPKACWDCPSIRWGYTGTAYASQAGLQVAAIKRMINSLTRQ
ncbi:PHB depolymerase [Acanthamoeba castellanii str. Neff]|uniref:PHB depolymerase n=1 Tax=Acanthamoeba castellanii (strain ATCC 30010 / Neff) TaxID=1257118 RepID=L8GLL3_ACACF|nr:PHB depolymerase [Acanthamoeba castellanii str. Neff]ELR13970.1 PHB depolymerase [Acanthamoeba castellanii str. Neff]